MKNDNDIFLAMSGYALINIDEFDAMSKSQQPILKYLISKNDVKFRPPYGKVMEERQRFASFIATTNNRRPLVDPTGSRRFICVYADEIDNTGLVPAGQQLRADDSPHLSGTRGDIRGCRLRISPTDYEAT